MTTQPERAALETRRGVILDALARAGGNRTHAARLLNYAHVSSFMRALKRLELRIAKGKPGRPKGETT